MPEQIKPNSTVERGFVDTGSLPRSPYADLIGALQQNTRSGINLLGMAVEAERANIEEKLSSPLLTAEEIDEIEKNAKFPVARLMAKNRKGQFLAEQQRATIEDDLASATDVVDARDRLIAHQARVLEGINDAGVAAGVREHFAAMGAPLLGEAAKRREVIRDIGERADVNGTLAAAAKKGGVYLSEIITGSIKDQMMTDPTKVSDLHTDAAQTIANRYAENPDTADDLYQAIDTVVGTPGAVLLESDKDKYLGVKAAIQSEERARNRRALAGVTSTKREEAAKRLIFGFVRTHPRGTPLPPELADLIETDFKDPKAGEKWYLDLQAQQGKPGVVGSDAYRRGLSALKAAIPDEGYGKDPVLIERRVSIYNRLSAAVSPSVLDDPQLLENTMSELSSRAEQLAAKEEELLKRLKDERALVMREQAVAGRAAKRAGDIEKATKIAQRIQNFKANPENRIMQREIVRSDLYRYAESLGIDIQDDLIDLFP